MKKFRVLAAALAICLSIFCSPAAWAATPSVGNTAAGTATVQTISTKKKQKNRCGFQRRAKSITKSRLAAE